MEEDEVLTLEAALKISQRKEITLRPHQRSLKCTERLDMAKWNVFIE
jgi:hypothetical protein